VIIAAAPTDAASCSAILHQWIMETPWFPNHAPESASEQAMRSRIDSGTVLVSKNGAGIDGFIAFSEGYLDCLYLTPEARDKKLGKALLDRAKALSGSGLALWVLAQNTRAIDFYRREGFEITANGNGSDNEENLPDIRMEWPIKELKNG